MDNALAATEKPLESLQQMTVPDAGLVGTIARVEIDTLISTARQYPRSVSVAIKRMCDLATIDEQASGECVYSLPRGGKTLEGPSIRFAELAAQSWANARVAARTTVIDRVEKYVEAEGFFLDAETNVATVARIRRRIVDNKGRLFNEDMIIVTCNAAQSIARRNAILAGIPKAVWRKPYEMARHVIMGDITTLANRRADAIKAFQRFGITEAQVLALMKVKGSDDIGREQLVPLHGMFSALMNQEITVEELLREIEPERAGRAPVVATIVPPAAFTDDVAAPTSEGKAPVPDPTEPPPAASAPAPQPTTHEPPPETVTTADPDTGELPDDTVIAANDIIARLDKAAGDPKAVHKVVVETQDEVGMLPEEQKMRVRDALKRANATRRKAA